MKTFYEKENYTYEDIASLIENETEESIYLDFKEAGALDKSDNKRKEISKDVASFANSDGGIIIYGIKEVDHKANSITFIDGNVFTKEWLEQVINSTIQRHIPELRIIPIRKDNQIDKSIYIVKIPKSIETPHLSKDKRFYKRFNFESVAMEEYEIRQLYGRKLKTKLLIDSCSILKYIEQEDNYRKFMCEIDIYNDGDISENNYKVNVYFINYKKQIEISWNNLQYNYNYTRLTNDKMKISSVNMNPIFPTETVNVLRFDINIPNDNFYDIIENLKLEIRLFYSNGEDIMVTDFAEQIEKIDSLNQDN